jgi:3-methyladenine DNA glycosylase/8-oxoguanine DNA glycosylase
VTLAAPRPVGGGWRPSGDRPSGGGPRPSAEFRTEVTPPWPLELPRRDSPDGLIRVRGGVVHRLLHHNDAPVHVRIARLRNGRLLFGARARSAEAGDWGIQRMRSALGVDLDLAPFHERFCFDPLIGPAVRRHPALRVWARPDPFEALVWAVCEQLIEFGRAVAIQRVLISRLGRPDPASGLRDAPDAEKLARQAPALLESFGLSAGRALTLVRVAREVASGRVDLVAPDHERGWARLRRIRGIGAWTVQMLALTGQGRMDQLPAGDLAYLKLVGRLRTGNPRARAEEHEVREFFEPYTPWAGLAGAFALRAAASHTLTGK